jgi:hypothetical protein
VGSFVIEGDGEGLFAGEVGPFRTDTEFCEDNDMTCDGGGGTPDGTSIRGIRRLGTNPSGSTGVSAYSFIYRDRRDCHIDNERGRLHSYRGGTAIQITREAG